MKTYLAAAAIAAGVLLAGQASAATPIIFQDFEGVDVNSPSFYTDYSYRSGAQNTGANSMYDEGTWTINDTPVDTHSLWINDTFASNKLILNGKNSGDGGDTIAWRQEAAATAGTYAFSLDVFDVCCNASFFNMGGVNATSILTFEYQLGEGSFVQIANVMTNQVTNFVENGVDGYRLTGTFDVAPTGNLRVSLRSWEDAPGGNDFAVDNISITAVPEPATWAMMIMGFGAAGTMVRTSRRRLARVRA